MKTATEDRYPDSDGKPMAETGIHVLAIIWLHQMLRYHFRARHDVYVAATMFLYYAEGQPKKRRAPDVMVASGVVNASEERRSVKIWVEGVVPSCIIEVTSKKTTNEDLKEKKPVYRRIGVGEYFMFDPLYDYLPHQLIGYRLVGKSYHRLKPADDNSLLSSELGLRLRPEGIRLGLYDAKTGRRLPTTDELYESANLLEKIEELQAEIARLKARK